MDYYVGVDIGTTATKVVAYDAKGEILAKQTVAYTLYHPQPGYSELKPDEVFDAVIQSLKKIAAALPSGKPVFVCFGAFMHSLIVADEFNNLLTDCITWADNRAASVADTLNTTEAGDKLYMTTGVPVHAMSPLCKILWLKENEPGIFSAAAKFIGIKEYIIHRLSGEFIIDVALSSATGLLSIHTLKWSSFILQLAGITDRQLSAVKDCNSTFELTEEASTLLPEFDSATFITGSSDGAFATIGSGAVSQDALSVTIGTSAAVRRLSQTPYLNNEQKNFCYAAGNNKYIIGGASNNGAICLQWLQQNILTGKMDTGLFLAAAEKILPGCDGLLFLPYILGERAPLWNAGAKAAFTGLDIAHTSAHMVRAVMEAVLYNLYAISLTMGQVSPQPVIYASGGFTQNEYWVQMLADVFNMQVCVPAGQESTCLGAVLAGMAALKIPHTINNAIGKKYLADASNHRVYMQAFRTFQKHTALLTKTSD